MFSSIFFIAFFNVPCIFFKYFDQLLIFVFWSNTLHFLKISFFFLSYLALQVYLLFRFVLYFSSYLFILFYYCFFPVFTCSVAFDSQTFSHFNVSGVNFLFCFGVCLFSALLFMQVSQIKQSWLIDCVFCFICVMEAKPLITAMGFFLATIP